MARVVVTGGGGFIGRHMVERFAVLPGFEVVCVQHSSLVPALDLSVATAQADLGSADACFELISRWQPDVVIHCASQPATAAVPLSAVNQNSAHWLLDAVSRERPSAHVVLFGSAAEYGLPLGEEPLREDHSCLAYTPYGRAKLAATEDAMYRARRENVRATVLRLFNVVGPGIGTHLPLGAFLARYVFGDRQVVKMGPIDAVRDFVAIGDVTEATVRAVERATFGEVINVCTGRGRSLRDLLLRMIELMGADVRIEGAPEAPATGLRLIVGDPGKCRSLLGFTPSADLDATLVQTFRQALATAATQEAPPAVPDVPSLVPDASR
jgi:GDP-4-dehydro-6-deoxy-D-mannose reductase